MTNIIVFSLVEKWKMIFIIAFSFVKKRGMSILIVFARGNGNTHSLRLRVFEFARDDGNSQ